MRTNLAVETTEERRERLREELEARRAARRIVKGMCLWVSGAAMITNGEREILLNMNESTYIPAGHKHRLTNPGIIDLVMIEVQSGEYLGEDDIVRYDDIYGRAPVEVKP